MNKLVVFLAVLFMSFGLAQVSAPIASAATSGGDCGQQGVLGFPLWYRGLASQDSEGNCNIETPTSSDDISGFISQIALNVLEIALVATAYVSVFFIMFGGFKFIVSRGNPDASAKARSTILYAVIGLVVSIAAASAVNFIVSNLLG